MVATTCHHDRPPRCTVIGTEIEILVCPRLSSHYISMESYYIEYCYFIQLQNPLFVEDIVTVCVNLIAPALQRQSDI